MSLPRESSLELQNSVGNIKNGTFEREALLPTGATLEQLFFALIPSRRCMMEADRG